MPTPRIKEWFHLKDDFTSFYLMPQKHARYLFGDRDRELRDTLLMSFRECAYSERGYRSVIWGNAGRGKTHLANHLLGRAKEEQLPLELVYFDCPTIRSTKEPPSKFFGALFKSMRPELVRRFVTTFEQEKRSHSDWEDRVLSELGYDKIIYDVIGSGLILPNDTIIKGVLGWLGGERYQNITNINQNAPEQVSSEEQISHNLGALGEMLLLAEGKNLIFLVDEAERLQTIQGGDNYWTWLSALREVFRRPAVGIVLLIIAANREYIPFVLWEPEIMSVIGQSNVFESPNFSPPDAESFLKELLQEMIQKDPMPQTLADIINDTGEPAECYPFTKQAYDDFVSFHSLGGTTASSNKPRELLNNLERAAQRAITLNKKLIDRKVLEEVLEGI